MRAADCCCCRPATRRSVQHAPWGALPTPRSRSAASGGCRSSPQQEQATPLLDAVLQRGDRLQDTPLHVPGHKRGRALHPKMQRLLGYDETAAGSSAHSPLRHDLTELAGLDYLSSPTGVIAEAQRLAAQAFGADHTWLLVNGCSVGIHAAVMASVAPGQALLLARNCHLSAFAACVLAGCAPVWLQPQQDSMHGVAHCVTPCELEAGFAAAAARGLQVGAVLVVSPTYFGAVARIAELAAICHAQGVPLLVDEAHGGHLGCMAADAAHSASHAAAGAGPHVANQQHSSSRLCMPHGALTAGADVVMHSSHKVLTAMTQAAMLHLQGTRVAHDRISKALQVLQTSSPSYVLLSSLDAARQHAITPGVWLEPLAAAAAARTAIQQLPGLLLLQHGSCSGEQSIAGFDPLRLVVNVHGLGLAGFDAAEWLERQHSIVPELATARLVVFVLGPGSTLSDADALVHALQQLCAMSPALQQPQRLQPQPQQVQPWLAGQAAMLPRDAFFARSERVPLHAAAGRVSAELLCPYPPGVPLVFPGEAFTADAITLLQQTLAAGGVVTGSSDGSLATVLCVAAAAAAS